MLIGFDEKFPSSTLQVWKLIHAETIRTIWASRCKRENIDTHFLELKAKLIAQIEYKLTVYATFLHSRKRKARALQHLQLIWTIEIPIASITSITHTRKGALRFTLNS
jgi:hypothetical protein